MGMAGVILLIAPCRQPTGGNGCHRSILSGFQLAEVNEALQLVLEMPANELAGLGFGNSPSLIQAGFVRRERRGNG